MWTFHTLEYVLNHPASNIINLLVLATSSSSYSCRIFLLSSAMKILARLDTVRRIQFLAANCKHYWYSDTYVSCKWAGVARFFPAISSSLVENKALRYIAFLHFYDTGTKLL